MMQAGPSRTKFGSGLTTYNITYSIAVPSKSE